MRIDVQHPTIFAVQRTQTRIDVQHPTIFAVQRTQTRFAFFCTQTKYTGDRLYHKTNAELDRSPTKPKQSAAP